MSTFNDDSRTKSSNINCNDWKSVRETHQSGELDKQNVIDQSEQKRQRRPVLTNTSTVSTKANVPSQKHQVRQLVDRARELQKGIVPDLLLYQIPTTYSPFSAVTPSSNVSRGSISANPFRQSISISSASSNSSIANQKLNLSSRFLERAHQIPERFWIDWQQKQMQDRIEELECIKNNIGCSSCSSLVSNETDENAIDISKLDYPTSYEKLYRQSLLYLQEAQRLTNEHSVNLAQTTNADTKNTKDTSDMSDEDDHHSFNFDQRSEETLDTAHLNDLNAIPSEPSISMPSVQQSQSNVDRSRSTISLPFTYTHTRELPIIRTNYRQLSIEPMLEKVTDINDNDLIQTTSSNNNNDDVAQIDTEFNLTLIKREHPKQIKPLLYSKTTVNRSIEFRKFRPMSFENKKTSLKTNQTILIPVLKRKEIHDNRSSSPVRSFQSPRLGFASDDHGKRLNHDIRSIPNISSLFFSCPSQPTPSHIISTIIPYCTYNNYYPLLKQVSSYNCNCCTKDLSMDIVYDTKENYRSSSFSSGSFMPSEEEEEEDNLSSRRSLLTYRRRQRKRKQKTNTSNLSLVSTTSLKNNLTLLNDSFYCAKENNNNNNHHHHPTNSTTTLNSFHNSSILSSKRTFKWKQNDSGFHRDMLSNDSDDDNQQVTRSLSSSAASTVDRFIRRQYRKQTRLKRKTESKKRKKKKKKRKKERNKKSPSSTTRAEATEASLFQYFAVDVPTIDPNATFYPYEQARYADKNTAKEITCFLTQTSLEHQQRQKHESKLHLAMADSHGSTKNSNSILKKKSIRVFIRRRRRTMKRGKRIFLHASPSIDLHKSMSSSSNNVQELVSIIERKINNKQDKFRHKKNIIVVNYKPVFVNNHEEKSFQNTKSTSNPISNTKSIHTDDDFSSPSHYSRQPSFTTVTSDGLPLRSMSNSSHYQRSLSLDVPDVEDPLKFIEIMYQQLFTEDGRLRSETEPSAFANCVQQIVTNSRRNSVSSAFTNRSTPSHLKHMNHDTNYQQRKFSSSSNNHHHHRIQPLKAISLSSSPHIILSEHSNTYSEEEEEEEEEEGEEEETQTFMRTNNRHPIIKTDNGTPRQNTDNHFQHHTSPNWHHPRELLKNHPATGGNGFRISIDDTGSDDLDTLSDVDFMHFNNIIMQASPSGDEDLTHTDSRQLSSGYQSLDRSRKSVEPQKSIKLKSYSENDLFHSENKNHIHYCTNCIRSPNVIVIPPITSTSLSLTNIIKRIQQPIGKILMKYVNFILISKNVLLLPLFIFLLRQRSIHIGV